MAINPDAPVPPSQVVRLGEQLWSHAVALAEAETLTSPKEPAYEFSNGARKDAKGSYAP